MSGISGIFCLNSKCVHYFEDHCMKMILEESTVSISEDGHCKDFEEGVNEAYKNCNSEDDILPEETGTKPLKILLPSGATGYECRNCGNELAVNGFNGNYCHWCGKRLSWEGLEE